MWSPRSLPAKAKTAADVHDSSTLIPRDSCSPYCLVHLEIQTHGCQCVGFTPLGYFQARAHPQLQKKGTSCGTSLTTDESSHVNRSADRFNAAPGERPCCVPHDAEHVADDANGVVEFAQHSGCKHGIIVCLFPWLMPLCLERNDMQQNVAHSAK